LSFFDKVLGFLVSLNLPHWAAAGVVVVISLMLTLGLKHLLMRKLVRASSHTHLYYDSLIFRSLSRPLTIVLLGAHLLLFERLFDYLGDSNHTFDQGAESTAKIALIVAIVLFVDRVVRGFIEHYALTSQVVRNSQGVTSGLLRGLIFGIGILVLLSTLGISVTPILASLGVTSLAVALALQPTLENLFSGMQLLADKPFQLGDFIALESGEQGFVEKIGWRSTWIRMLANNLLVIPNSKVCQDRILNYNYPSPEMSVPIEVGVHYSSNLQQVQAIAKEVAIHILQTVPGGKSDFEPRVNFHTFGDSSVNFTVVLRATEFTEHFALKSEFIKLLHQRFNEEGICIPFPIMAINTEQERALCNRSTGEPGGD
jgi:small-conductance mechanosensitive channel